MRLLIAPAAQKADEISRASRGCAGGVTAATAFVLALARGGRSTSTPATAPALTGTYPGTPGKRPAAQAGAAAKRLGRVKDQLRPIRQGSSGARQAALTPAEQASPLARRPYDLRHACLSTWLNGGVYPTQVAEWAGHSVDVLLRIYAKCVVGQDDRAIVKTCGSRSLGGFGLGFLAGPFDELAVDEGRSGADQGDQVGCVDGAPAVLG